MRSNAGIMSWPTRVLSYQTTDSKPSFVAFHTRLMAVVALAPVEDDDSAAEDDEDADDDVRGSGAPHPTSRCGTAAAAAVSPATGDTSLL